MNRSGCTTCRWNSSSAVCSRMPSPTWGWTNGCGRSWRTSASTTARCSPTSRTPRSATAASVASPPASWTPCRPWASPPAATAFATTTGCSASPSRTAGRSRRPRTGCARSIPGSSNARRPAFRSVSAGPCTPTVRAPPGHRHRRCWPSPTTRRFPAGAGAGPTRCGCGPRDRCGSSTWSPSTGATGWPPPPPRCWPRRSAACSTPTTPPSRAGS